MIIRTHRLVGKNENKGKKVLEKQFVNNVIWRTCYQVVYHP